MSVVLVSRGITVLQCVKSAPLVLLAKTAKRIVATLSMEKTANQDAIVPKINVTSLVDVFKA